MPEDPRNRLEAETSAYLRSAAAQPVGWYPWGEEAFAAAEREDKPILLDIGGVWCHWCHVMDHESYDDEETAALINELFIPVKVDRDERPDVDARYQRAVQMISGQGGWPLTAFLTPDGAVFFGGTYFPPDERYGRPGLRSVLRNVAEAYESQREAVAANAAAIRERLAELGRLAGSAGAVDTAAVDEVMGRMALDFDTRHGGFGRAPKFPHPSAIDLALARHVERPTSWTEELIKKTLDSMARGGIHDQIGGGFHRYATDEGWVVPHFEKMSYDNSELLRVYSRAAAVFGEALYAEVAEGIVEWVREVASDPEVGGFFASQDADVGPDDDGDYWTWTVEEAREAIADDQLLRIAQRYYDIDEHGEMAHDRARNVLFVAHPPAVLARALEMTESELRRRLDEIRDRLKTARDRRPRPFVDTTLYTNWNAMMAGAFLDAFRYLGRTDCRDQALTTLDRIWRGARDAERGLSHRLDGGSVFGLADDHVQTAAAMLDAFEVTQDREYLDRAESCATLLLERFWDEQGGGFFDAVEPRESEGFLAERLKPLEDTPSPSVNGVAALTLGRLSEYTGDGKYADRGRETLEAFGGVAKQFGYYAATYFRAVDLLNRPACVTVVVDGAGTGSGGGLLRAALSVFRPRSVVRRIDPDDDLGPELPDPVRGMLEARRAPMAYVCAGAACAEPTADPETLESTLRSFGL